MNFFLKKVIFYIFFSVLIFSHFSKSFGAGADVIDSIEEEDRVEIDTPNKDSVLPNTVNEIIKKISPSKKIFIISNENQSFSKGDFISLLISNQLVCRALVAKSTENKLAGIKIVKIYNMGIWNTLTLNKEVAILKGDDSYFTVKDKQPTKDEKKKDAGKIQSEEDLYNSTSVTEDDQSVEENSKRLIKPDNLLGLNYGLIQGQDSSGSSTKYPHLLLNWSYQVGDNIWGEVNAGMNTIKDYPHVIDPGGLDTQLISFSMKIKYTINAPLYSYVMPYAGYQIITANSPGAGKVDTNATTKPNDTQLAKELSLVDDLKRNGPIFGVTFLKRVVPGWFIRADLGSDIISGGLTLEF